LILAWVRWKRVCIWSHGSRDAVVMIADGIHEGRSTLYRAEHRCVSRDLSPGRWRLRAIKRQIPYMGLPYNSLCIY
jgi:hypothetical protein